MTGDVCGVCGGDGRIGNSFGLTTTCPSCHGTRRRSEGSTGVRDVTKTKPSHYQTQATKAAAAVKQTWPATFEGRKLATEVQESAGADELKSRLIREIIDYEQSRGSCTQTFSRKVRKQIRPKTGG